MDITGSRVAIASAVSGLKPSRKKLVLFPDF
jgi:hypothetical protein